jgi:hypothetical protein
MKKSNLYAVCFFFSGASLANDGLSCESVEEAELEPKVTIVNSTIYYDGWLAEPAIEKMFSLYEKAKLKPTKLVINSSGGAIELGMEVGGWVYDHKLDVQVDGYCASSCANYIFPAGKNKYLANRAIIGFHGGASSLSFDESEIEQMLAELPEAERALKKEQVRQDMATYLNESSQKEAQFFKKIGVEQRITTLGQQPQYDQMYNKDEFVGWTYKPRDFANFGVTNLTVLSPPWELTLYQGQKKLFLVPVPKVHRL